MVHEMSVQGQQGHGDNVKGLKQQLRLTDGFRAHSGAGRVGDAVQRILHAIARAYRRPRLRDKHLRDDGLNVTAMV